MIQVDNLAEAAEELRRRWRGRMPKSFTGAMAAWKASISVTTSFRYGSWCCPENQEVLVPGFRNCAGRQARLVR